MTALFEMDNLGVCFGSKQALSGVSLSVRAGEYLGVIGPNGSGKSTLLRAMAGAVRPSAGRVRLDGRDVSDFKGRELARRLAVVPQDGEVSFDFSLLDVVLMGRSPRLGRFQREGEGDLAVAERVLERTNLLDLAGQPVGALSGGERQRAMIARALAQETDVLFLDEPTAHLDINFQVEILHLVARENRENGKTVVVVLHDLNLAAEFCDRLVMLSGGEVFADGSPDEVITAENVQSVYGSAVWVRKHPTSGRPYVLSPGSRAAASRLSERSAGVRVHVICGGGSGGQVFLRLLEAGCEVTAGVINIGDTDQEAAESLGIEYVENEPFSAISEAAERANEEFIGKADAVVVAGVPFGRGNLPNLAAAVRAAAAGKRVAIIGEREKFGERDFADGRGVELVEELISKGASVIASVDEIADWVGKFGNQSDGS